MGIRLGNSPHTDAGCPLGSCCHVELPTTLTVSLPGSAGMTVSGDRSRVEVRLFGSIAVQIDGRTLGPRDFGGTRPKQVLEILLSARGSPVPVDHIAENLWGERLPTNYAASIQTFVSTLRRHLCADQSLAREIVVTERGAYRFAVERASVDIDRFDDLLAQAGRAASDAARRSLLAALALAVGDVLEDEPYAEWTQDLRGTYRGRMIGAAWARTSLAAPALPRGRRASRH